MNLPPSTDYTGSTVTQGGKKTFMTSVRTYLSDLLGADSSNKEAARSALGVVAPNRNRFINGNFSINQLVLTGTVTLTAGQYGHDGWKGGAAGCTYTFITVGLDTTVTISAGSLLQVSDPKKIEGGIYTLSNAGTAQARIGVSGSVPASSYAACPITAPIAAAGQSVIAEFTTGTLSLVQLEPGAYASAFERLTPAVSLRECQVYFEKSYDMNFPPGASSGVDRSCEVAAVLTNFYLSGGRCVFKVPKAATPTIVIYNFDGNPGSITIVDSGDAIVTNVAAVPRGAIGMNGFTVQSSTGTIPTTAGNSAKWQWTASNRL